MIFVAGFSLQNDKVLPFLPPHAQDEKLCPHILCYARQNELSACL